MKYIFVEGYDDKNFVNEIINKKEIFRVIEYSGKKKEKIDGYLLTINKMQEEYIFLADLDEKNKEDRIEELKKRFKNLDESKIYFSIQEIEAWYLSGVSDKYVKKYKIKDKLLNDTENITKEKFEKIFVSKRETILEIKLNLLSQFNVDKAKSRNNSLKVFLENAV